jgi:hypothetical protein
VAGVTGAQRGQVRGDLARSDRTQVGDARHGQDVQIPFKITTVRAERVGRQPALHGQVVEIAAHHLAQLAHQAASTSPSGR